MPKPMFFLYRRWHKSHSARPQRGAAALALMLLLGVSIGLLVIEYARGIRGNDVVDPRTIQAMSKAREALLGYATTYRDTHPGEVFGYFPCPDMGTGFEGHAAPGCGGQDVTVIGRLPWRTLDLPPLRDANGECLWYAVSGNFKNNPKTKDLLNRDTNGLIEVVAADGTSFRRRQHTRAAGCGRHFLRRPDPARTGPQPGRDQPARHLPRQLLADQLSRHRRRKRHQQRASVVLRQTDSRASSLPSTRI